MFAGGEREQDELLTDEEFRDRLMSKPEVQEANKRALERVRSRNGTKGKPGITAEELQDFLREHG